MRSRKNTSKKNTSVKNSALKQKRHIRTKSNKHNISRQGRILKRVLLGLLILFLLFILVMVIRFGIMASEYQKEAKRLVKEGGREIFKANQTSILYDSNGEVITELIGDRDSYYLEYSEIPYFVKRAMITTEDRNFYEHSGVDGKAVLRAFVELVKHDGEITQGGSTITQQLARNIFLTHEVTMERKLKEMFIAFELEKTYSKDDILEFYINNIYFANGYYGIEAAARGYFGKTVSELSIAEMAFICAIPNNPSMYDPYVNSEQTTERKNRILKQMYQQKDIDKEMYEEALYATIVLVPTENETINYVETYARYCATIALMKHSGFEFRYYFDDAEEKRVYEDSYYQLYDEFSAKLYTGGYRIYTSIDLEKQELLQKCIDEQLTYYTGTYNEGVFEFQGAAACIDNHTGKVVAIVGGRTQDCYGFTLNRAYQSYRQPGSTIKPILTYTPVLERGYYPETMVKDEPIENGPVNSPDTYDGEISLRYAVEKSKNTVAWDLFGKLTAETAIPYLLNMEFKKIVKEDYVPAMSIGGMTYGVSPVEMASAYAAIENDGQFRSPTCITKITDADYNIIIDNINYMESETTTVNVKQIYSTNAARMMTDILTGVLKRGTAINYQVENAICAAKTGTTNENKDIWFVGYSRYYTTAVWAGYDLPKEISDGYGTKCSGQIWQRFMSGIHAGLEQMDFVPYMRQDGTMSNGEPATEITTENPEETTTIQEEFYTENPEETSGIEEETVSGNAGTNGDNDEMTSTADNIREQSGMENQTTEPERNTGVSNHLPMPSGAGTGELYTEYWGE